MKSPFNFLLALSFAGISAMTSSAFAAAGTPPDVMVKDSVNEVITALQQHKDKRALRQLAEQKIAPNFNFEEMTKLAVGRSWSEATPEQQKALQAAFRTLLINTYSNTLSQASPDDKALEVQPLPGTGGDDVTVRTKMRTTASRQPIAIDYRMANSSDGWKVYDVTVESLSLVTTYRGSFAEEIKRSGIAGLIKTLQDKNQSLAAG